MSRRRMGAFGDRVRDRTDNEPMDAPGAQPDSAVADKSHPQSTSVEGNAFSTDLRNALAENRLSAARTLVATAEAILATCEESVHADPGTVSVSRPDLASAKARIAMTSGDTKAAHAILVQAIEAHPDVAMLRTLMAEVMLATGRAKDVRPVLHYLGRKPVTGLGSLATQARILDSMG